MVTMTNNGMFNWMTMTLRALIRRCRCQELWERAWVQERNTEVLGQGMVLRQLGSLTEADGGVEVYGYRGFDKTASHLTLLFADPVSKHWSNSQIFNQCNLRDIIEACSIRFLQLPVSLFSNDETQWALHTLLVFLY